MDDIFIYTVRLPDGINEAVLPCADGFTIYLSDRLDEQHRRRAFEHALCHIKRNDWEQTDVQRIEAQCHEISLHQEDVLP